MQTRHWQLLLWVLFVAMLSGCQHYTPVTIRVQDGESGEPIGGATLTVLYVHQPRGFFDGLRLAGAMIGINFPYKPPSVATTDQHGLATVPLRTNDKDPMMGVRLTMQSCGYIDGDGHISNPQIEEFKQTESQRRSAKAIDATFPVYRKPYPKVFVILPEGYRGLVRLRIGGNFCNVKPGQRNFGILIHPPKIEAVPHGPLLGRAWDPVDYGARYPDGPELLRHPQGDQVGFAWIGHNDVRSIYLVGTAAEIEAAVKGGRGQMLPQDQFESLWNSNVQFPPGLHALPRRDTMPAGSNSLVDQR